MSCEWTKKPRVIPSLFEQSTEELARQLLGMVLVHETQEGTTAGRIVEVEMYRGVLDKAAHSYKGIPTKRTQVMFGRPGHAYVYFVYGMYHCFNVVAAPAGVPEAILVRALEPLCGYGLMANRRGMLDVDRSRLAQLRRLTSGPGRLAAAMGITKEAYGLSLWQPPLYLVADAPSSVAIGTGTRVNIGYAEEAQHFPWRYWLDGNAFVS